MLWVAARLVAFRAELAPSPAETARRVLRALLAAVLGFLVSGVAVGLGTGMLALFVGALTGAAQFEGAFAMGVAATMPVAGLFGGAGVAMRRGRRSWHRNQRQDRG